MIITVVLGCKSNLKFPNYMVELEVTKIPVHRVNKTERK